MLIPLKMATSIKKYFYDKTANFYSYESILSVEGGRPLRGEQVSKGSIECNIQPTTHAILKEKYGIDIDASYVITCDKSETVEKKWLLKWNNEELEVKEVLPYDSHLMILCQ